MSWSGSEDQFEKPPEWFTNVDELEPAESERQRWRSLLVPVATLMILVLVLVSAIQAAILHERRNDLPDSEFERTAVLFGTSLLLRRSFGQALIFAADGAERDVREIMLVLSERSPAEQPGGRQQKSKSELQETAQADANEASPDAATKPTGKAEQSESASAGEAAARGNNRRPANSQKREQK